MLNFPILLLHFEYHTILLSLCSFFQNVLSYFPNICFDMFFLEPWTYCKQPLYLPRRDKICTFYPSYTHSTSEIMLSILKKMLIINIFLSKLSSVKRNGVLYFCFGFQFHQALNKPLALSWHCLNNKQLQEGQFIIRNQFVNEFCMKYYRYSIYI